MIVHHQRELNVNVRGKLCVSDINDEKYEIFMFHVTFLCSAVILEPGKIFKHIHAFYFNLNENTEWTLLKGNSQVNMKI